VLGRGALEVRVEIELSSCRRRGVLGYRLVQHHSGALGESRFYRFPRQLRRRSTGSPGLAPKAVVQLFVEREVEVLTSHLHASKHAMESWHGQCHHV